VYNPRKQRGKFAKWQVCWKGPVTVERKLNDTNYVLCKGKGKAVVVHVDRMRKLPNLSDNESADSHMHTKHSEPTIQLCKRRKTANATDKLPSIHCMDTVSCADRADRHSPLVKTTETNTDGQSVNVCMPSNLDISVDTAIISSSPELASQSTDAMAVETVTTATKPLPLSAGRPSHIHHRPS